MIFLYIVYDQELFSHEVDLIDIIILFNIGIQYIFRHSEHHFNIIAPFFIFKAYISIGFGVKVFIQRFLFIKNNVFALTGEVGMFFINSFCPSGISILILYFQ